MSAPRRRPPFNPQNSPAVQAATNRAAQLGYRVELSFMVGYLWRITLGDANTYLIDRRHDVRSADIPSGIDSLLQGRGPASAPIQRP